MKTTAYIVATDAEFDWALLQRQIKMFDAPEAAEQFMRDLAASLHVVEVVTERTWVVHYGRQDVTYDQRPDSIPDDAKITEHVHTARRVVSSMAVKPQQEQSE